MINCYIHVSGKDTLLPILNPIINYIAENAAICQIMFENSASNDFVNRFHNLIHQNGLTIIHEMFPNADEPVSACFFEFITYGLIGMLKQWIDSGMQMSPQRLANLADKAVMGTASYLLDPK